MTDENEHLKYRYTTNEDIDETTAEEDFAEFIPKKPNRQIPHIRTKKLTQSLHPTTKMQQAVTKDVFAGNTDPNAEFELSVGTKKTPAKAFLNVVNESSSKKLDWFHIAVHNVVCSFFNAGETHFTAKMVAKELNQNKPTKNYVKEIEQALLQMATTYVNINHQDQAKQWKKPFADDTSKTVIQFRYMLKMDIDVEVYLNNTQTNVFMLNEQPPLLEYALMYEQNATLDKHLIDIAGQARIDRTTTAIWQYLIHRINMLKGKGAVKNNSILFSTLYDELNLSDDEKSNRNKRDKIKKHVDNILKAFKNNGYIKSYSFQGYTSTGKIIIKV